MYLNSILVSLILMFSGEWVESAKILAIGGTASPSHHFWNLGLIRALGKRGHEITYLSPDIKKDELIPNTTAIHMENFYPRFKKYLMYIEGLVQQQTGLDNLNYFRSWNYHCTKHMLESKEFDDVIELVKREKFDLFIFDYSMTEALLPVFDYSKDTPIVGLSAYGATGIANYMSGNPESLAVLPNVALQTSGRLSLLERIQNVFLYLYTMYDRYSTLREQAELAKTKFPNADDLSNILDRFSIFFVNTDLSLDPVVPRVPALIGVGGLHIEDPKPLPKDLQSFLDGAKNGAIVFSLGSNIKSSNLKDDMLDIFVGAFKELAPIRVLWKFEKSLPNKPNNVMIAQWLPQNDVLAHPNIRMAVIHSGLLSTQEAIARGKPFVGVPFFTDQFINIAKSMGLGIAEKYDLRNLTTESFIKTVKKVFNDPRYTENIRRVSRIYHDQPQKPVDRAVFWTEYAIRHKGAPHIRSAALNLQWYENILLDVVCICVSAFLAIFYVAKYVLRALHKIVCKRGKLKRQ